MPRLPRLPQLHNRFARRFSTKICDSILDTIGNTPVVRLNKVAPKHVDVFVKLEYFNPLSSVKDRMARGIIEDAEKRGELQPGQTVVEATSGNAGIALALVCAAKGYPFVACMTETFSVERRKTMRALGAKVILTPAKDGGVGMVKKAQELAAKHGWFSARQFENESNTWYHANSTGPEILTTFAGRNLDYWVTGYGSGGTFTGAGKVLKAARPDLKIILVEPDTAAMVQSGLPQERDENKAPASIHPAFTPPVMIQGWAPSFIPQLAQDGLDANLASEVVSISSDEAMSCALELARMEGIFTGISGGATVATALKVAQSAKEGSSILAMAPDTMERYLSTPLFDAIGSEMNEAEMQIAASTDNYVLKQTK